jgi:hypothetical protein
MTLAFDVRGCSVLVEPSDQGRKPQPVTAHNRLGGMITAGVASTGRAVFAG